MFGGLFGKHEKEISTEPFKFREAVLKVARQKYKNHKFTAPSAEPEVIVVNETQLGLQNLRAKFELSDRSQTMFEELVQEHFDLMLKDAEHSDEIPGFEEARSRIFPQIMPPEFAQQAPLVVFPFVNDLLVGLVLDSERSYLYLKLEDVENWGKSPDELLALAIENLKNATADMEVQFSQSGLDRFIAIETDDGFDAAKILIPKFRKFLAEHLKRPFYFAIPNRDFLIAWSADSSPEFQTSVVGKVRQDNAEQPYSLSPNVYQVTTENKIV